MQAHYNVLATVVGVTAKVRQSDQPSQITAINDLTSKIITLSSRKSCTTSKSPSFYWRMSSGEFVG